MEDISDGESSSGISDLEEQTPPGGLNTTEKPPPPKPLDLARLCKIALGLPHEKGTQSPEFRRIKANVKLSASSILNFEQSWKSHSTRHQHKAIGRAARRVPEYLSMYIFIDYRLKGNKGLARDLLILLYQEVYR